MNQGPRHENNNKNWVDKSVRAKQSAYTLAVVLERIKIRETPWRQNDDDDPV